MLAGVTTEGTGKEAWVEGWGAAGKTSSAETGRVSASGQGISDAWFAGYAPLEQPRYALAVLVEDGGSGGQVAAPVFQDIVSQILTDPLH
jgi:cell division protein FtsI/penicillin-binding protein 2